MLWSTATSGAATDLAAASACSGASPAAVSAIVGHSVPAPVGTTSNVKASPQNFGASDVATTCTYGIEVSHPNLKNAVLLESQIESKAFTAADVQAALKRGEQAAGSAGLKFVPYSGLGVTAFYFTETTSGIYFQGIAGIDGKHVFSAAVYSKTLSQSKLGALAKLAEKL
jgi:hypothetical protein